jgi:dipeptidyl aminopeptidase/acylaminoacyl peptidase
LTDPALDLARIASIVATDPNLAWVLTTADGPHRLYRVGPTTARLVPVPAPAGVSELWPGGSGQVLALAQRTIWQIGSAAPPVRVTELPPGAGPVAAAVTPFGPVVVAVLQPEPEAGPQRWPPPRPTAHLWRWDPCQGWRRLAATAPAGRLRLASSGARVAWTEPVSALPEEAARGELVGWDSLASGARQLTCGAGRLVDLQLAPDGRGIVYLANHDAQRPITAHPRLWWIDWHGRGRRALTAPGRCVEAWGWAGDGGLWVTFLEGMALRTERVDLEGGSAPWPHPVPVAGAAAWSDSDLVACAVESRTQYPAVWVGGRQLSLPQAESWSDLQVGVTGWTAPDGACIPGLVYETAGLRGDAPLLVHVHGGPAAPLEEARGEVVGYRHLLRAGYRVLKPAFRGTLGFGDRFSQANIGVQGRADLDDIVAGVHHLGTPDCGVIGRSYGGYMVLRALAVTDCFRAGVAISGFIDNRWMSLETGDLTYENEFIGPLSWPPDAAARQGDVFPRLGDITAPLLLAHGAADPVCPVSQARAAYGALAARGCRIGLVIYPREGHRLGLPAHQHDCNRRVLAFLREFLPVAGR